MAARRAGRDGESSSQRLLRETEGTLEIEAQPTPLPHRVALIRRRWPFCERSLKKTGKQRRRRLPTRRWPPRPRAWLPAMDVEYAGRLWAAFRSLVTFMFQGSPIPASASIRGCGRWPSERIASGRGEQLRQVAKCFWLPEHFAYHTTQHVGLVPWDSTKTGEAARPGQTADRSEVPRTASRSDGSSKTNRFLFERNRAVATGIWSLIDVRCQRWGVRVDSLDAGQGCTLNNGRKTHSRCRINCA